MTNEISFEVAGYPPAKNEALSMLGPGHPHNQRVVDLLQAARSAMADGFVLWTRPVCLDVEVRAASPNDPWDATNYLGGIGDVLEDKSGRGLMTHLKEAGLDRVALYKNDRLIREVHYRQVDAAEPSYRVRVWLLAEQGLTSAGVGDVAAGMDREGTKEGAGEPTATLLVRMRFGSAD